MAPEKAVFTVDSEFDQIYWQGYPGPPKLAKFLMDLTQYFPRKWMINAQQTANVDIGLFKTADFIILST